MLRVTLPVRHINPIENQTLTLPSFGRNGDYSGIANVGVDAQDDGLAINQGRGGNVAVRAGHDKGLPGRAGRGLLHIHFDFQDAAVDCDFHGFIPCISPIL